MDQLALLTWALLLAPSKMFGIVNFTAEDLTIDASSLYRIAAPSPRSTVYAGVRARAIRRCGELLQGD